jgi:hypothetical protein
MKTLYNVDHLPVVVVNNAPAVKPGESYDFTDEQVEAGITGRWSETRPTGPRSTPLVQAAKEGDVPVKQAMAPSPAEQ